MTGSPSIGACSSLEMPGKPRAWPVGTEGTTEDWTTGSRSAGPRGIRGGLNREKRLAMNFGPAVEGNVGASQSGKEVACSTGWKTTGPWARLCPAEDPGSASADGAVKRTAAT